ncbi:hypothetical protein PVAG01_04178 [Phlyctema vagabunda]|uniref:Uncharacterized protein n=1 Tax=Phlyctema vagabunda TaxID=108571 RepID=A0ABR4PP49_9HELO
MSKRAYSTLEDLGEFADIFGNDENPKRSPLLSQLQRRLRPMMYQKRSDEATAKERKGLDKDLIAVDAEADDLLEEFDQLKAEKAGSDLELRYSKLTNSVIKKVFVMDPRINAFHEAIIMEHIIRSALAHASRCVQSFREKRNSKGETVEDAGKLEDSK